MACDRRGTQIGDQYDADSFASRPCTFSIPLSTCKHSTGWELDA
jgi:hypothetical protein